MPPCHQGDVWGVGGEAEALNPRSEHFPAICTTKTLCHVLVRLQFGFVIIPLNQKEVMHTKETPNHCVRRAINHLLLNIKEDIRAPSRKARALKSPLPHNPFISINLAFILGEGEGERVVP